MITASPYDGACPSCGHQFSLAELKRMAMGDGWQRMIWIVDEADPRGRRPVSFHDFDPVSMKPHNMDAAS